MANVTHFVTHKKLAELVPNRKVLKAFIAWIESFGGDHALRWGQLYNANAEAAMSEATFWAFLTDSGVSVRPNDEPGNAKSPDFHCSKDGCDFYVEVTCLTRATISKKLGIPEYPDGQPRFRGKIIDPIFEKVRQKTPQCANLGKPCLVAIGTFHFYSSMVSLTKFELQMLLTGESLISWYVGSDGGKVGDTFTSTAFNAAAFLKPDSSGFRPARQPISGILVGGFGTNPIKVLGIKHPFPNHEFDNKVLSAISWCKAIFDEKDCTVTPSWTEIDEANCS